MAGAGRILTTHAGSLVRPPALVELMAGTDCGFAQGPFVRRVHPTIQWAKLEAMVAGARLATKELWSPVPMTS
jgi:hypothetical protein